MTQRYFDHEDLALLKEVLDANVPSAIDGKWTRRLQKEFATATEAKRLMREVIDHHLDTRTIQSRKVVRDLWALEEETPE